MTLLIQLSALILVGLYLVYEAALSFFDPQPQLGVWIMPASVVALVVDIVIAWLLWAMSKGSLNLRAVFLHNLTDAGSSLAVLLGVLRSTGWIGIGWIHSSVSVSQHSSSRRPLGC